MEDNGAKPGQTVTPTGSAPPAGAGTDVSGQAPVQAPGPEPQAPAAEGPRPEEQQFTRASSDDQSDEQASDIAPITWTASEFIDHAKSGGWYLALALGAIVFAVLVYLLTKDRVSTAVVIVVALVFGVYAGHKPRELEYRLDVRGLTIGSKHFTYDQFKSFSVLPEGAFSSIVFMPLHRFAVPTTIYYAPEDEDKIVALLSNWLPFEQRGHDAVDRLMHRIHF